MNLSFLLIVLLFAAALLLAVTLFAIAFFLPRTRFAAMGLLLVMAGGSTVIVLSSSFLMLRPFSDRGLIQDEIRSAQSRPTEVEFESELGAVVDSSGGSTKAEISTPADMDLAVLHEGEDLTDASQPAGVVQVIHAQVAGGQDTETVNSIRAELPTWVKTPPTIIAGRPAIVVVSDKYETVGECEENLRNLVESELQEYVLGQLRDAQGFVGAVALEPADLRRFSKDRFVEVVETSVGPMQQIHQLLVFDADFDREIQDRMRQVIVGDRLSKTGFVSGAAFVLLAATFGFLRISNRSNGKSSC
ncbi:MAG: hypothetical protein P8N76_13505 [Pirellulaceae bacterium]|nr:hypothetical protein [Pirellulaceae bacterium]